MREDGLRRIFERVRGEFLPVFDDGLVFKQLKQFRKLVSRCTRANLIRRKKADLVDVLPAVYEFLLFPVRQQTEFSTSRTYLSSAAPDYSRRSAEGYELFQFLPSIRQAWDCHYYLLLEILTTSERSKHFSMKMKSSSDMGVWRAMIEGRYIASARITRSISFLSNLKKVYIFKNQPTD